jgi:hypothetical protein
MRLSFRQGSQSYVSNHSLQRRRIKKKMTKSAKCSENSVGLSTAAMAGKTSVLELGLAVDL